MPQIKCHSCGRVRLVVEGKRKLCRGCGTKLTSIQQPMSGALANSDAAGNQIPDMEVAELAKIYPKQVAEIVAVAKADVIADELDIHNADEVAKAFPDAVKELETAAKKSILKLSAAKFAKLKKKQSAKKPKKQTTKEPEKQSDTESQKE